MKKYCIFLTLSVLCSLISGMVCAEAPSGGPVQEILAQSVFFDEKLRQVKYTLPEQALVRIRIGMRYGGPLLVHLVDWEYRGQGEHIEIWDKGTDKNTADFTLSSALMMNIYCKPADAADFRRAPKVSVIFPEAKEGFGEPIIAQRTNIKISLEDSDFQWLSQVGYETIVFVDGVFYQEIEKGENPLLIELDPDKLNVGNHILTVNVVGFFGDIGIRNTNFVISKN